MLLKIGYIALTVLMLIIIINLGLKTINKTFKDPSKIKKKKTILVVALLMWQVYIYIISSLGLLSTYELPPRFPIFLIFPTFLFTGIFIYKNRNNAWIRNIKPATLIYIQSFRVLVEILFVFSITEGILPKLVTIEGYNFDMIVGILAPIVAYLVFNKKVASIKVALYWNYLGLAVLASVIFLFLSSTFAPQIYNSEVPLISLEPTKYPYTLIAGFLMPAAVFLHVLSIVQLSKKDIRDKVA